MWKRGEVERPPRRRDAVRSGFPVRRHRRHRGSHSPDSRRRATWTRMLCTSGSRWSSRANRRRRRPADLGRSRARSSRDHKPDHRPHARSRRKSSPRWWSSAARGWQHHRQREVIRDSGSVDGNIVAPVVDRGGRPPARQRACRAASGRQRWFRRPSAKAAEAEPRPAAALPGGLARARNGRSAARPGATSGGVCLGDGVRRPHRGRLRRWLSRLAPERGGGCPRPPRHRRRTARPRSKTLARFCPPGSPVTGPVDLPVLGRQCHLTRPAAWLYSSAIPSPT